jgi:hypothetical protein
LARIDTLEVFTLDGSHYVSGLGHVLCPDTTRPTATLHHVLRPQYTAQRPVALCGHAFTARMKVHMVRGWGFSVLVVDLGFGFWVWFGLFFCLFLFLYSDFVSVLVSRLDFIFYYSYFSVFCFRFLFWIWIRFWFWF